MSTKIKFTSGTLKKLGSEIGPAALYDLELFNAGGVRIYAATLPSIEAAQLLDKHNTIKLIK